MQSSFFVALAVLLLPAKIISTSNHVPVQTPTLSTVNKEWVQQHSRVYHHHTYEVIDTACFIVYRGSKSVEKIPNKGQMVVTQYYFSKTIDGDIYELSIINLEKAFPGNIRFHYALEQQFRSDNDLMAYDNFAKMYKMKYLFSESIVK